VHELAARYQAEEEARNTHAMLIHAEKIGAVGQLASGVAHEVKNPLAIILQSVNYLEQDASPRGPQQSELLSMIKEAVLRADKIVRALLNFSRQEPLELKPDQLNAIIDGALELAQKQMSLRNVTTARQLAPALPLVQVSADHMKQVLINILLNALQAMPGGGQLTIRTLTTRLNGMAANVGRRKTDFLKLGDPVVVCEITDTGSGIPKDLLGRVFDPFYTTKPVGQGTGLGLSISRSIVEAHRGLMDIDSEVGRGTTVRISLPAAHRMTDGQDADPPH
jgi:signal transduction histidine kinase